MPERNVMKMEFSSLAQNVAFSRSVIAAFASQLNFTLPELDEIRTATSEAVSNCVIHGYDNGPGIVFLEASVETDQLTVVITDHGRGIDDIEQARGVQFTTRPGRYGLGFTFMEAFMDSLEVDSHIGEGTQVRMTKRPENVEQKVGTA